jgi:hypothetical protein
MACHRGDVVDDDDCRKGWGKRNDRNDSVIASVMMVWEKKLQVSFLRMMKIEHCLHYYYYYHYFSFDEVMVMMVMIWTTT